jgi:hypothetical protein
MAAGLFGVSWTEIIDYLIKLAPAASIVGGIFAARAQLRNNRRINAERIAKNHYREMLDAFLKNADIVYLGLSPASFAELKKRHSTLPSLSIAFHSYGLRDAGDVSGDRPEAREKLGARDPRVHFTLQALHSVA